MQTRVRLPSKSAPPYLFEPVKVISEIQMIPQGLVVIPMVNPKKNIGSTVDSTATMLDLYNPMIESLSIAAPIV